MGKKILLTNYNHETTHPIHKSIVSHGPDGYEYDEYLAPRWKCWMRTLRNVVFGLPEYDVIPKTDADAVFSIGLLPKTDKPWMAFLENYTVFSNNLYYPPLKRARLRRKVLKMIKADNCFKIVAYSDIARDQIRDWLQDKEAAKKIDTLHPVIADFDIPKIDHKKVTILFIANTDFYGKGGKEVLQVADKILQKHKNVEFVIKSPVPKKYLNQYENRKGVMFITERVPDDVLLGLYARSDIYLFPLYTASTGVFFEAKIASLPIITTDTFDIPDFVADKKTGLLVHNPQGFFHVGLEHRWRNRDQYNKHVETHEQPNMVDDLVEATEKLIQSERLRKRLGNAGKKEMIMGQFSIAVRNKKLAKLYKGLCK